jgi:hypothetical protein
MKISEDIRYKGFNDWLHKIYRRIRNGYIVAHNFLLEERFTNQRLNSYDTYTDISSTSPSDINDWNSLHNVYLDGGIWTENYLPETFTEFNKENFLYSIQEGRDQWIIKLESDQRLYSIISESVIELENLITTYHTHPNIKEREDAKKHLQEIIDKWNEIRDWRPSYVAFWGEVKELFEPTIAHDWPDKLRDSLGLLHLDPTQNGIIQNSPLPIILMRYPVEEVLEAAALEESTGSFAIPTVLDGKLSEAFCPSPSSFVEGRAVNLTDSVDNYNALCEVLHYRISYKAKHIFKFGWIKQPPGSLEPARSLHLEWLRDKSDHNDFHIIS